MEVPRVGCSPGEGAGQGSCRSEQLRTGRGWAGGCQKLSWEEKGQRSRGRGQGEAAG